MIDRLIELMLLTRIGKSFYVRYPRISQLTATILKPLEARSQNKIETSLSKLTISVLRNYESDKSNNLQMGFFSNYLRSLNKEL